MSMILKLEKRNISNLQNANDTTLIAKNANELKALVIKAKEHCEKNGTSIKYKQDSMIIWYLCSVNYISCQFASSVIQDPIMAYKVPYGTEPSYVSIQLSSV